MSRTSHRSKQKILNLTAETNHTNQNVTKQFSLISSNQRDRTNAFKILITQPCSHIELYVNCWKNIVNKSLFEIFLIRCVAKALQTIIYKFRFKMGKTT